MNKIIHYPDSNRIGSINILFEWLKNGAERPMFQALFGLFLVLDVVEHESGRGITYIAASDLFQPLKEEEEVPQYRIEFVHDQPFENPDWEARRINNGKFGFVAIRQNIVRVPAISIGVKPRLPGEPVH